MRVSWFLPAVLALITDLGIAVLVHHQPDYPIRFVTFQIVMVGAALLIATQRRSLWEAAILILLGGTLLAGMSVGVFCIPTLGAAAWVMARRLNETQATPSFLDTKPRDWIFYTPSELDAVKNRRS